MNISKRIRVGLSVLVMAMVFFAGAFPAWVAEKEEKNKAAKVVDIGMAKDPIALLDTLEKRREELEERYKILEIREADLKRLEEKMGKRIAALEQLREAIRTDLSEEKNLDDSNIKRLAKIFSGMKPKAAAASLMAMDKETALKTLKMIPEKVAAKILSKMNVREAVQLSDALGMSISDKRGQPQQ